MPTENTNCPTCGSDVIAHLPDTDGGTGYYEPVTIALRARVAELEAALSVCPCTCDELRGFGKCPRCSALNK